jgi:DNA topoisomerase III
MGSICHQVSLVLIVVPIAYYLASSSLQRDGFQRPRNGKNDDKAHPPIHPTAYAANLAGDDKKIYEYITRRFLASCSKDAVGFETTVDAVCGEEEFYATGKMDKVLLF